MRKLTDIANQWVKEVLLDLYEGKIGDVIWDVSLDTYPDPSVPDQVVKDFSFAPVLVIYLEIKTSNTGSVYGTSLLLPSNLTKERVSHALNLLSDSLKNTVKETETVELPPIN